MIARTRAFGCSGHSQRRGRICPDTGQEVGEAVVFLRNLLTEFARRADVSSSTRSKSSSRVDVPAGACGSRAEAARCGHRRRNACRAHAMASQTSGVQRNTRRRNVAREEAIMLSGSSIDIDPQVVTTASYDDDWKHLHRRLRSIARRRVALEAEEASCLVEAEESRLYRRLGYTSMIEYIERELHWGPHAASERLRVAHELIDLPLIAEQFHT